MLDSIASFVKLLDIFDNKWAKVSLTFHDLSAAAEEIMGSTIALFSYFDNNPQIDSSEFKPNTLT